MRECWKGFVYSLSRKDLCLSERVNRLAVGKSPPANQRLLSRILNVSCLDLESSLINPEVKRMLLLKIMV